MRGRVLLWFSLGLNVALAAWVAVLLRSTAPATILDPMLVTPFVSTNLVKTNFVVRQQNFVWRQIESEDYEAFIRNLRKIGCPETTIRDIIVADVSQLFARRRASEVVTGPQQWWRSDPDPAVTREAVARAKALEDERHALLTRLLGPDWDSADYPLPSLASFTVLDGPVLGVLPPETKLAVHRIEQQSLERQMALLRLGPDEARAPDEAGMARLRQQTREELARVLNPEQLEEYLLRYSANANQLRSQLRGFDTRPEEFRSLFRALDPLNLALQQLPAGETDPETAEHREELERQRQAAIEQALGPERYEEYRLTQDPVYRQARTLAEQAGVDADKILPLAVLYRMTEMEEQRIRSDTSLTVQEQMDLLEATRSVQQDSLRRLLGEEAFERYRQQRAPAETEKTWIPPIPQPNP